MHIKRDSYLLHSLSNRIPLPEEIAVNKLAIVFYDNQSPVLYTKDYNGNILPLGKGVERFIELKDVDISNAEDGSFFIKQGDKYVASNFIGSISNLTDIEIQNPISNQYLRYNPLLEAFSNYYPSYYLHELLDVEVANPHDQDESYAQNKHVIYYDHESGKYKTRPRINTINELIDVEITPTNESFQLLALDTSDGIWKNRDLEIINDPNPTLGNNLNANGYNIQNSSYKVNTLECNQAIVNLNYIDGDYWILNGYPTETINQCVVNINLNTNINSTVVLMLEIRQSTGSIVLGNLENVKYEDGRVFRLSGNGKTDLLTITQTKTQVGMPTPITTTYITVTALNLATLGQGGISAYRYDKNRYPFIQEFSLPTRYDDYYDYVESLLTFEPEVSTNKAWLEDKAIRVDTNNDVIDIDVVTSGVNVSSNKFNLGIEDKVLKLLKGISNEVIPINGEDSNNQYLKVTHTEPIVLEDDFTIELYLNYTSTQYQENTTAIEDIHYLFSNETSTTTNDITIKYLPYYSANSQTTELLVEIGNDSLILRNAYTYFYNKVDDFYTHICIQRHNSNIELYIDGILQNFNTSILNDDIFTIDEYRIALVGQLSTFRITNKIARYSPNLINTPALRFGLVGGANDILDRLVFNSYNWLDRDLEHEIFCI